MTTIKQDAVKAVSERVITANISHGSLSNEMTQLANMVSLLGFAAEAHRTLTELHQAGRVFPEELGRIHSLVEHPCEWMCRVPGFSCAADSLADRMREIAMRLEEAECNM